MKKSIVFALLAALLFALTGCKGDTSEENYFGGKGEFSQTNRVFWDDTNIYFGWETLKKFNKETKTVSLACQTPGCTHSNSSCKSAMHADLLNPVSYCVFNGSLIKGVDERVTLPDGTIYLQGYLYLCGEDKQVFENVFPDGFTDEQKKERPDLSVGNIQVLGEDYLAIRCSGFIHILDTDFNIKFTILDMGLYGSGVYLYDNDIYYIDRLYRLMKLDKETGEVSGVDLNSMRITEGQLYDGTLWFLNEDMSICSYDFKTGETKEYAQKGGRLNLMGKYLTYIASNTKEYGVAKIRLLDMETCEDKEWDLVDDKYGTDFFCIDGNYYSYDYINEDGSLTQYSEDLSEIANVYTLTD